MNSSKYLVTVLSLSHAAASLERIIDMAVNAEYESRREAPASLLVLNDREQAR